MAPHAAVLVVDLHLPHSQSLKDKRSVVRSIVDGARRRHGVSAAETGHGDTWQRSEVAFAAVGSAPALVDGVLDAVERHVWSHPEVEVLATSRHWTELDPC